MTRKADGPALVAWFDEEMKTMPDNADGKLTYNSWSQKHGLAAGNFGRWKNGMEPTVERMSELADALGRPFVDILVAARVLTEDEIGIEPVRHSTILTPEEAIEMSNLNPKIKESLLGLLDQLEQRGNPELGLEVES